MTNVLVIIVSISILTVLTRNIWKTKPVTSVSKIAKGMTLAKIPGIDYAENENILFLALNTQCKYCTRSIPFYKKILEASKNSISKVKVIALFSDKKDEVEHYLHSQELSIAAISEINFDQLKIEHTPSLILVDSKGVVLSLWTGKPSEASEAKIFNSLSLPSEMLDAHIGPKKSFDIFAEDESILTVQPETSFKNKILRVVNLFDVDKKGNIYLENQGELVKYNPDGNKLSSVAIPKGLMNFCVSPEGKIYLFSGDNLLIYYESLRKVEQLKLPDGLPKDRVIIKAHYDVIHSSIYLQVYDTLSWSQQLFSIDVHDLKIRTIFKLENPAKFQPFYTPGAFDFCVSKTNIYISDIHEYKIFVYSLKDKALIKTFIRPYPKLPIIEEDGDLKAFNYKIGGLGDIEGMKDYPPILHLSYAKSDRLLVWTNRRDHNNRQLVEVYDDKFRLLGIDYKYIAPCRNVYKFINDKVYVPDLGFGEFTEKGKPLSLLDIPRLPLSLKVFALSMTTNHY